MRSPASVRTAAVIGGGIGGLAAAIALRRVGIDATVFERAPALQEVGAGISLWPNATLPLQRLGVLESLLPRAGVIRALSVRIPSGETLNRARFDGFATPALCAHRADLVSALREKIPEESVRLAHALESLSLGPSHAEARFGGGEVVRADVLIGADGIRSTVREHLLDRAPPIYRGYAIWRGIAPLPGGFDPGEIFETWGDGVRFGLLDCGRGRGYWYAAADRPDAGDAGDPARRKAELLRLFEGWHDPIPEVIRSTPAEAILRDGALDRPPHRPWHRGRAVLIGDAAHPTTPNQGQGGCMAIEDAVALARTLSEESTPEAAFRAFQRARFARTRGVTRESRLTGRLAQASGWRGELRNALMRRVPASLLEKRAAGLFRHDAG